MPREREIDGVQLSLVENLINTTLDLYAATMRQRGVYISDERHEEVRAIVSSRFGEAADDHIRERERERGGE